jgi:hypothetical protein
MASDSLRHLKSDHVDLIALGLDEDVYGANGDLDDFEIKKRLVQRIHEATNCYEDAIPVWSVANLIYSVWADKDRDVMDLLCGHGSVTLDSEKCPAAKSRPSLSLVPSGKPEN